MPSVILKISPIVDIDNEIAYSECTQEVPKFVYNIVHKIISWHVSVHVQCFIDPQ